MRLFAFGLEISRKCAKNVPIIGRCRHITVVVAVVVSDFVFVFVVVSVVLPSLVVSIRFLISIVSTFRVDFGFFS